MWHDTLYWTDNRNFVHILLPYWSILLKRKKNNGFITFISNNLFRKLQPRSLVTSSKPNADNRVNKIPDKSWKYFDTNSLFNSYWELLYINLCFVWLFKINHYPGMSPILQKETLCIRTRSRYIPKTFTLPHQRANFMKEVSGTFSLRAGFTFKRTLEEAKNMGPCEKMFDLVSPLRAEELVGCKQYIYDY